MLIEPNDAVLVAQQRVADLAQELWVEAGTPIYFDEQKPGQVRLEGVDMFALETTSAEDLYQSLLKELTPDRVFTYEFEQFGGWNTLAVHQFGDPDDQFYATIAISMTGTALVTVISKTGTALVTVELDDVTLDEVVNGVNWIHIDLNLDDGSNTKTEIACALFVTFIQPHLNR